MFNRVPRYCEPFDFPQVETEPVAYTPLRSEPGIFMADNTEMMVAHDGELEIGEVYRIAGRVLRIDHQTDLKEFQERFPNARRLARERQMKFYVAIPE